ncbi:helix-turn-helix transcriptional regulator [Aurantiacibacter suaedae]|uniref:helix-turn-helix transcriptional regulator n=1 Tax=Aurantiacibacter suaedae TaxID=2545755 RepID=UPI0010F73055|nr:AlpA family phage regulatory protein [Aurantiacibacter suaedae]
MSEHLLDIAEVERRVGIKRAAIYKRIRTGNFPRQVRLIGVRKSLWKSSEIAKWVDSQLIC